ncbi:unnamed protein product, partial [Musa acuminata var. zebrina]
SGEKQAKKALLGFATSGELGWGFPVEWELDLVRVCRSSGLSFSPWRRVLW